MNILLIESQNLYRDGLVCLIGGFADDLTIQGCSSIEDSLSIVEQYKCDLIVLSSRCGIAESVEGISLLVDQVPSIPIVLLPVVDDLNHFQIALKLGVKGIITPSSTHEELLAAFQLVCAGGVFIPREMVLGGDILDMTDARKKISHANDEALKQNASKLGLLSDRQTEVLQHLIQGNANKTISDKMNISENTVKTHLSAIFRLLGVRNRTEAVYFATHAGIEQTENSNPGIAANF